MTDGARHFRLTPWGARLMAVNLSVLLLLSTVFTAPRFATALTFDPASFAERPWTIFSYMFVHAGVLHLAVSMALLFVFGPPTEQKLGSRKFLVYYTYCGVGGALFALILGQVVRVDPIVGASGALYGLMLA